MPVPTCGSIAGLTQFDQISAIYCALIGDTPGALPSCSCVEGYTLGEKLSAIYCFFYTEAEDDSLPACDCIRGLPLKDQWAAIYCAALAAYPNEELQSCDCVRWQSIEDIVDAIYCVLYVNAGSPPTAPSCDCIRGVPMADKFSAIFATITGEVAPDFTLVLAVDYTDPADQDSFARSVAAGYTGLNEPDWDREAQVDALRTAHFIDGNNPSTTILQDIPTPCQLSFPTTIIVIPGEAEFDASFNAVVGSVDHYEWRLDNTGSWTDIGLLTSFNATGIVPGEHILNVRAVTPSGVPGTTGDSAPFTVEVDPDAAVANDNFDAYANASLLGGQGNWATFSGNVVVSNLGSGGSILATTQGMCRNTVTANANQRCVLTAAILTPGSFAFICAGVRCQIGADTRYWFQTDGTNWFLVERLAAAQTVLASGTHSIVTGDRIALDVTGAGAATRLTAQTFVGGVWSNVTGCVNIDPGMVGGNYIDGGSWGVGGDGAAVATARSDNFEGYDLP